MRPIPRYLKFSKNLLQLLYDFDFIQATNSKQNFY